MQKQESKVDMGKALYANLDVMKSSGTEYGKQDTSSKSGNDANANNADIKPVYDKEPMAKVQLAAECNVTATGQQHTEQPEIINEGRVDKYTEQCQVKSLMINSSLDNKTTGFSNQSLESENICLKKTVAQFQKDFSKLEAHCIALELKMSKSIFKIRSTENADLKAQLQEKVFAIAALKNELRKLKGNRKLLDSCTSKVDSEPPHGSNTYITNPHECKQTLDSSAEVPTADMIVMTSMPGLESLFDPLFDEYVNGEYQVVSKSFAVTIADASDKRQQQPDLASSTSTLATTVTTVGNTDL
ncbi:hypothetical protein Tco_1465964 [Tanacetum coccineum]